MISEDKRRQNLCFLRLLLQSSLFFLFLPFSSFFFLFLLFSSFLRFARLACVRHAASVHPEPGSNSLIKVISSAPSPFRATAAAVWLSQLDCVYPLSLTYLLLTAQLTLRRWNFMGLCCYLVYSVFKVQYGSVLLVIVFLCRRVY